MIMQLFDVDIIRQNFFKVHQLIHHSSSPCILETTAVVETYTWLVSTTPV